MADPQAARLGVSVPVVFACAALAVVSLIVSQRSRSTEDVDQAVYEQTLTAMHHGQGYYPAMRDAVARKEGAPPSQVRAIRPPTEFLLLSVFPASWWRPLAAVACFLSLLAAAVLGSPFGKLGPLIALAGAGVWLIAAMPHLFLHPELWGLPWFLVGLIALRRKHIALAAASFAVAVLFRELYAIGFLVAFFTARPRTPFVIAATGLVVLTGIHVALASGVTSSSGHQVALGNEPFSVSLLLSTLSPADRPVAWIVGLAGTAAGGIGVWRLLRADPAARVVAVTSCVIAIAAVIVTRAYWTLVYGPALFTFIPGINKRAAASASSAIAAGLVERT
jgi:hypothetical protein